MDSRLILIPEIPVQNIRWKRITIEIMNAAPRSFSLPSILFKRNPGRKNPPIIPRKSMIDDMMPFGLDDQSVKLKRSLKTFHERSAFLLKLGAIINQ